MTEKVTPNYEMGEIQRWSDEIVTFIRYYEGLEIELSRTGKIIDLLKHSNTKFDGTNAFQVKFEEATDEAFTSLVYSIRVELGNKMGKARKKICELIGKKTVQIDGYNYSTGVLDDTIYKSKVKTN